MQSKHNDGSFWLWLSECVDYCGGECVPRCVCKCFSSLPVCLAHFGFSIIIFCNVLTGWANIPVSILFGINGYLETRSRAAISDWPQRSEKLMLDFCKKAKAWLFLEHLHAEPREMFYLQQGFQNGTLGLHDSLTCWDLHGENVRWGFFI